MDPRYEAWIKENIADPYGCCQEATLKMQEAFPELERIRGHYYCPIWGQREHWWLVAPDQSIVDPTSEQFPSKGNAVYEPWDETQDEPTGICMECGSYTYGGKYFCSKKCEIVGMAYLNARY